MESKQSNLNIIIAKIFLCYLWGTYFIYRTLPIQPVDFGLDETYSIIFLCGVSLSFILGCKSVRVPRQTVLYSKPFFNNKIITCLNYLTAIVLVLYTIDLVSFGLGGSFNMGESYVSMLQGDGTSVSYWGQINVLLSPFRYFLLGYCIYYYNQISGGCKLSIIVLVAASMFHSIFALGTQKGIGDIVIILVVLFSFKAFKDGTFKKNIKKTILIVLMFIAFLSISQASRREAFGSSGLQSSYYYNYNSDNILCNYLGKDIGEGLIGFFFYMSNGYPGLNYCLQMPFEWTGGIGSSKAADSYANSYLHVDSQFERTYPIRMEKIVGWPGEMFWPTAFSWLASDLTFFGVIIIMYFFAKFLCVLFKESYYYDNILSIALLAYYSIGVVYLPANNQLFQSRPAFISTITLTIIWFIYHKQLNHGLFHQLCPSSKHSSD